MDLDWVDMDVTNVEVNFDADFKVDLDGDSRFVKVVGLEIYEDLLNISLSYVIFKIVVLR